MTQKAFLEPDDYGMFLERIFKAYLRRIAENRDADDLRLAANLVRSFRRQLMLTADTMATSNSDDVTRIAKALGVSRQAFYQRRKLKPKQ